MLFRWFPYGALIAAVLVPWAAGAQDVDCIAVTFVGLDDADADATAQQLENEMKQPVHRDEGAASCHLFVIEQHWNEAKIVLVHRQVYRTVVHLDDTALSLRPRAVALAAKGLWVLAKAQAGALSAGDANPGEARTVSTDGAPASGRPQTDEGDGRPNGDTSPRGIRGSALLGLRWIPTHDAALLELAVGVGVRMSALQLDLSLVGLWGRKTVEAGEIYTVGIGARAALFWRAVMRPTLALGIGPAVEVLGVLGYGRGKEGVASHRDFYPVVNVLLLLGGWFDVSPRTAVQVAAGGGWSTVYFEMAMDGKTVTGISGGCVNLLLGVTFGAPRFSKTR